MGLNVKTKSLCPIIHYDAMKCAGSAVCVLNYGARLGGAQPVAYEYYVCICSAF